MTCWRVGSCLQDKTSFVLKWLEPESLYFLQVQALSQFGRERIKSAKAAIFLNTGDHKNGKYNNHQFQGLNRLWFVRVSNMQTLLLVILVILQKSRILSSHLLQLLFGMG